MKHQLITVILLGFGGFCSAQNKTTGNLQFDASKYKMQEVNVDGKTIKVRAFEKIIYVSNPVDTNYQVMNIYVPEAFFQGQTINGYSASTAPIFFPNQIGGYMPSKPAATLNSPMGGMPPMDGTAPVGNSRPAGMPESAMPAGMPALGSGQKRSAVLVALSKGYVVASAGARGRTTKNASGEYTGKSPAAIVDLKAAIRYLKFNDKVMPGDAGKIVSNGTSAGGAFSTLLGATGNNADYESYLKELGAAPATDDIFAVSAYCPITNLENADMAYEWQFNGINTYKGRSFGPAQIGSGGTALTAAQIKTSAELKALFPAYLNGLGLKDSQGKSLAMDANGEGSFKELVKSYVIASAQKALYGGIDLSKITWLNISGTKVMGMDFNGYVAYMQRQKTPPAFDAFDLSAGENQEFGTATIDKQHFTHYAMENASVKAPLADPVLIKMLNPMAYIGDKHTKTAKYWRLRHGTNDKDTGLAISIVLGTYLKNKGFHVSLELPWDKPHSGDYDLNELFAWIDSICK